MSQRGVQEKRAYGRVSRGLGKSATLRWRLLLSLFAAKTFFDLFTIRHSLCGPNFGG